MSGVSLLLIPVQANFRLMFEFRLGCNTNAPAPEVVLASLSVLFGSTRALKRDGGYRCESPKLGVKYHTKRVTVTANSYPVQILKIKIFRLHPQALL